jgi:hypothetical protein
VLGRGVGVREAVHVGRGVFVGVSVHTTGVRVIVGVADNAAMKACLRSVLAADVARALISIVGVGVREAGTVVSEDDVEAAVAAGGCVRSGVSGGVKTGRVGSVARAVCVGAATSVCAAGCAGVCVAAGINVVEASGDGTIWLATDGPNRPTVTLNRNERNATRNHCCPARVRARRVRWNTTVRAA